MICQGYLKIINYKGETIYTLYHESKECMNLYFIIIDNVFFYHK